MRLIFVIGIAVLLTPVLAATGAPGVPASSSVPPLWFDPIDGSSLSQWQVVAGDGTARIVDDPDHAERTYLRVEDDTAEAKTRVVGPSVPTPLPVRVGFVPQIPSDTMSAEVRLVDVDGNIMTRVRFVGISLMLEDGDGDWQILGSPSDRHLEFHLASDTVRAGLWDTTFKTHPAVSDRPFDHIEVLVGGGWSAIDHVTVIPEGSGFVDFFQRHTIEGPHTPWELTASESVRRQMQGPGALTTAHSAVAAADESGSFRFSDARLAQHPHAISLFFRSGTEAYTVGMPVLFGLDASGAPLWSVELTHVRYAGRPDLDAERLRDMHAVTLRLPSGEEVEVLPPSPKDSRAFSTLHAATDPVAGVLEVRVDDAPPVIVDMPGLAELATLGVGDVYDDPKDAPHPLGWAYVDGVVAGYQ